MSLAIRLLNAIQNSTLEMWDEDTFNAFASEIFQHQRTLNPVFSKYCEKKGLDSIDNFRQFPAIPTEVFRRARVCCEDYEVAAFMTSGTTKKRHRGVHYFPTLEYYRAAIQKPFQHYVMGQSHRIPILMLVPPPELLPDSSLSFMMGELAKRYSGHFDLPTQFYVEENKEDGKLKYNFPKLINDLDLAVKQKIPVLLMGTAFALVEFLDFAKRTWDLPEHSRILETGGLKGKTRELEREEMYKLFKNAFNVPDSCLISEYSMTELSSQAYTTNFADRVLDEDGYEISQTSWETTRYQVPPWVKVEVAHPRYLRLVKPSKKPRSGLLRWYDLANYNSVVCVQTSDLATLYDDGTFTLDGRASKAELRGCSMTAEDILAADRFL